MSDEPIYDGRAEPHQIGNFGGIYFRRIGPLRKGDIADGHRHYRDHITAVMTGSVRVKYRQSLDGAPLKSAVFIAPINFEVAAELYHEIEALEDGTSYLCLFWNEQAGDIPFNRDVEEPAHG
jgi:hypothetical protein